MVVAIPKECADGERRVALTPSSLALLKRDGHSVFVESGAGLAAGFSDEAYLAAGAEIAASPSEIYARAQVVFKVRPPQVHPVLRRQEAEVMPEGCEYFGFLNAFANPLAVATFARRRITSYALEFVPRISRAQSMDALSSMATVAGYKAVLLGAVELGKMFPLMMTAAGTVSPATVLVIGVGVAGLQAIATARRLGAKVEAFDPRPAVRDQVKSLGATFIEMELPKDAETAGGYAKELSPEFIRKEMEAIGARLPKVDLLVCTAQVFGKKAPVLVSADMVKLCRPGTVIVDLAAEQGGNCELTRPGETVDVGGVRILGAVNLPASVPLDASQMLGRNLVNLFRHVHPKGDEPVDEGDEVVKGCCVTRGGSVVHELLRKAYNPKEPSA